MGVMLPYAGCVHTLPVFVDVYYPPARASESRKNVYHIFIVDAFIVPHTACVLLGIMHLQHVMCIHVRSSYAQHTFPGSGLRINTLYSGNHKQIKFDYIIPM